jgi:two-component system, cell cycle sensor histidine kinase and response regulator CckA
MTPTGIRVLIVEDEALIAEELRDRLEARGFMVTGIADTFDSALAVAETQPPDLVLLDIRLRGAGDGIELGAVLHNRDIPFVYLTAHSDPITREQAIATSPYGYLLKPFQDRDLIVAVDVALHRHALEHRLRESESRYVATLSSIGDGVIATDVEGHVTFINPVAAGLTGWPAEAALGRSAAEVFAVGTAGQGAEPIAPVTEALRTRQIVRFGDGDLYLRSRDGDLIPIDDCAAPVTDAQGHILGAVVAFRDDRERRVAAAALQRAREDLFQSQKLEAVGRLAGGVAHDFNNLLTVINGCTEMALEDPALTPGTRELLREVASAGTRAAGVTRQFLAFGRRQILQPKVIDLNASVAGIESLLRRLSGETVRLRLDLAAQPLFVLVDPTQLDLIVINLSLNARDAMPDGGELRIVTSRVDVGEAPAESIDLAAGAYAALVVSDTGSGMSPEVLARIFEPYYTTKEVGQGSGLGLASVHGIVKQSRGHIVVASDPGSGSEFTVYLPLVLSSTN